MYMYMYIPVFPFKPLIKPYNMTIKQVFKEQQGDNGDENGGSSTTAVMNEKGELVVTPSAPSIKQSTYYLYGLGY